MPAADYLLSKGIALPEPGMPGQVNYDALAAVFMQADDTMPAYLVESLFLIHEMADEHGMDAILDAQAERRLQLQVGDNPEPADVAVQAWLENPQLLEELHNQHQLTRPRSFYYFSAGASPLPQFNPPLPEQVRALEKRLADWYLERKRGRGCKVLVFPKGSECWFLVRHGLPCKRESAIKDGEPTSVFYRPQKHDVVVYDAELGELRINGCNWRELEEFRKAFGMHLFGDEEFFPGSAKYTLAPLVQDGPASLVCSDIEGLESVVLKEVEFRFRGSPGRQVITKSPDIFQLQGRDEVHWPDVDQVARAVFEVKFKNSKRSRRVTIMVSNRALYGRDEDALLVEQWLQARGFILSHESLPGCEPADTIETSPMPPTVTAAQNSVA